MADTKSIEELQKAIIEAITRCLKGANQPLPEFTAETVPLKDLDNFDSLCALEVIVQLEKLLNMELGEDLFRDQMNAKKTALSIGQIAALLHSKQVGGA